MKKLAIIGSGEAALIIADEANKLGIETHSFSFNATDRVVGHSFCHHVVDIHNTDEIVDICRKLNVSGVISTTELTIAIAAKVASLLSLNGMDCAVADMITDKGFVRDKAKQLTIIKQPWYTIWKKSDNKPSVKNYPVIVKPTSLGGKKGVSVALSNSALYSAIEYSISNMPAMEQRIIIEEYIDKGKEYSVETMSYKGKHFVIQVTEKITSGPPHCVELGHLQPAEISIEMRDRIERGIEQLLEVVGIDNTVSHIEIKVVGNEIFLIEINARSGGDHIAYPLTEISTGYPYIQAAIHIAMDDLRMPDVSNFERKSCGVIFIVKQTEKFVPLFEECERYPWLFKKHKQTGELVEMVNNHSFDTNYFIFKADTGIPAEIRDLL